MKEFIEKLIGRLEEEKEGAKKRNAFDSELSYKRAISIVNQLAEEYKDKSSIIDGLRAFLKEKFDYCAEQAGMNLEAECNSEIASYFRDRKELYLDRANIYGEVMRECDRLAEEYNNGWIPCSEKLPEVFDNVLICTKEGGRTIGHRCPNQKFGRFYDLHSSAIDDVIAWQPLPEPYQPKGE